MRGALVDRGGCCLVCYLTRSVNSASNNNINALAVWRWQVVMTARMGDWFLLLPVGSVSPAIEDVCRSGCVACLQVCPLARIGIVWTAVLEATVPVLLVGSFCSGQGYRLVALWGADWGAFVVFAGIAAVACRLLC